MSPVEGDRKVVILDDFHLVRDTGPALLKTVEEPPPTTVFVILAEYVPPELATIASRCVRVDFAALGHHEVASALEASGVAAEPARRLAEAAGGRMDRARLLASDPDFERRRKAWSAVPGRLDGTGATAAALAAELVALTEASLAPLQDRQAEEVAALLERNRRAGEVISASAGQGAAGPRGRGRSGGSTRHQRR